MDNSKRKACRSLIFGLCSLLFLAGCIRPAPPEPLTTAIPYRAEVGASRLNNFAPVFWIEEQAAKYNRIGAVRAATEDKIFIDPKSAVFYAEERHFSTAKAEYTNLIYRVHFPEVPGGFSPYFLGAGKNVGLLIVITLNAQNQPLLVTSVHSCGCYLAFIPTSYLAASASPEGWPSGRQAILSESLPTNLNFATSPTPPLRLQIRIRSGTHRVMDVWLAPTASEKKISVTARLKPLQSLRHLTFKEGSTSFYETSGSRKGYVKGSYKPRERLLMSWWALAWKIGQDKSLGKNKQDGPVFYTSLKPWAREASDMRDFAKFLDYWGWAL